MFLKLAEVNFDDRGGSSFDKDFRPRIDTSASHKVVLVGMPDTASRSDKEDAPTDKIVFALEHRPDGENLCYTCGQPIPASVIRGLIWFIKRHAQTQLDMEIQYGLAKSMGSGLAIPR